MKFREAIMHETRLEQWLAEWVREFEDFERDMRERQEEDYWGWVAMMEADEAAGEDWSDWQTAVNSGIPMF